MSLLKIQDENWKIKWKKNKIESSRWSPLLAAFIPWPATRHIKQLLHAEAEQITTWPWFWKSLFAHWRFLPGQKIYNHFHVAQLNMRDCDSGEMSVVWMHCWSAVNLFKFCACHLFSQTFVKCTKFVKLNWREFKITKKNLKYMPVLASWNLFPDK